VQAILQASAALQGFAAIVLRPAEFDRFCRRRHMRKGYQAAARHHCYSGSRMKPETRSYYTLAVQGAIEQIVHSLDEAIDLGTLADRACLSPFHFHRIFRGMTGETPMELIRRLRMERAAWQLTHTDRAVTEIAFEAGYETHEAFTRAFRTGYNMPPSAFRLRKRPHIEIAATCGIHFDATGYIHQFVPRDSGGQHMNVEIQEMPALRVGAIHHTGPYNQISPVFAKLGAIAGPAGLLARPGAACMAIFHDDPEVTPPDQLRSDAAVIVGDDTVLPPQLAEHRLPAGRYARAVHVGPYEQLGDAWGRFMGEWLPASGYRIGSGGSYEIYRNDPTTTPKEQLRTEMYISIE
jgi:AraC family transcriptional regulator